MPCVCPVISGIFCTGPMSVEALKNGLIHLPYDGHFVFAEVNADRVHWIHPEEGGYVRKIKETCMYVSQRGAERGGCDEVEYIMIYNLLIYFLSVLVNISVRRHP